MLDIPVNMGVEKVNGVRLVSTYADEMIDRWGVCGVRFADFVYQCCPAKFADEFASRYAALVAGTEEPNENIPEPK